VLPWPPTAPVRLLIDTTAGLQFYFGVILPLFPASRLNNTGRSGFPALLKNGTIFGLRYSLSERQVLERIVAGRLNKQIADDLGISIKTVEAHRANIMEKLNVNTVADLLRLALSDPQPN